MNKVMTRTKRQPGTRPPVRHDTRRPGRTPARTTPGGGHPSTAHSPAPATPTPPRTAPNNTTPSRTTPSGATPSRTTPSGATPGHKAPGRTPTPPPVRPVPQPRPTDHFADLLLSVLSGRRPVHSMLRHTAGRAYDELAWLAERGPLRTTRGAHPVVRDIGYYVAAPGALEVFARIGAGDQLRAMAFRLEHGPDHRWRCTAVELGGPRLPHQDDD